MAVLSQRAYARHREVAALCRPEGDSPLVESRPNRPDGRIDSDVADAEWAANTRTRPPAGAAAQEEDDDACLRRSQYTKARAVREHYQARLAKIEYEERVAKLVSKDEVQVAAFNKFRQFRDAMLNIPDRVAAMVAAETEAAKCYEILATEIRKALNEFADCPTAEEIYRQRRRRRAAGPVTDDLAVGRQVPCALAARLGGGGPVAHRRTPYLREIMDCLSPSSPIERMVFMKGAQIGGTECGNNWIGYVIHQAPGPMMAMQPTVEMAKRNSKQRVDPLRTPSPGPAISVRATRATGSSSTAGRSSPATSSRSRWPSTTSWWRPN